MGVAFLNDQIIGGSVLAAYRQLWHADDVLFHIYILTRCMGMHAGIIDTQMVIVAIH